MTFVSPLALVGLLVVPARRAPVRAGPTPTPARRGALRCAGARRPVSSRARPGWRRHVPFALALAALTVLVRRRCTSGGDRSPCPRKRRPSSSPSTPRGRWRPTTCVPTRLQAAQEAARGFLEHVPEKYRVAIVSFSTEAQVVLQPSVDREAATLALGELRLGSGTAIGDAIVRSLETVRPALAAADPGGPPPAPGPDDVPATVLLLSDGAQTLRAGRARPRRQLSRSGSVCPSTPSPSGRPRRSSRCPSRAGCGNV